MWIWPAPKKKRIQKNKDLNLIGSCSIKILVYL